MTEVAKATPALPVVVGRRLEERLCGTRAVVALGIASVEVAEVFVPERGGAVLHPGTSSPGSGDLHNHT